MTATRIADLDPAHAEAFTRTQKLTLLGIVVVSYVLTTAVARPLGFFAEPGFGASVLLDEFAAGSLMKVMLWTLLIGIAGTFAGRAVRPDAGLMAACAAFLAIRRVGGEASDVYLYHSGPGAFRMLALEMIVLALVLAAIHTLSRLLVARGVLRDDAELDQVRPKPEELRWKASAVLASALTTGLVVLILCRSDERMQVTAGLAVAGFVAALCAVRFIPAAPSSWFWAGPIAVGVFGYAVASLAPGALIVIGEPGGYAPALVHPLPLDYASAGVAGALYGYWVGRKSIPEDSLES